MTQRLDQLDENQLFTVLTEARQNLDEFKNRQFTGVLGYVSKTANTWDYQATISTGSPFSYIDTDWTLRFTSDGSQQYPLINPAMDIFCGTPIEANRLQPNQTWTDGTNSASLNAFIETDKTSVGRPSLSSPTQLQWYTIISVAGNVPIFVKGYGIGSCRGTIVVTRTA